MKISLFVPCFIVSLCSTVSIYSYADTQQINTDTLVANNNARVTTHKPENFVPDFDSNLQDRHIITPNGVKIVRIDNQQLDYNDQNDTIDSILSQHTHTDVLASDGIYNKHKAEKKVPLNNISPETLKTFVKVFNLVRREYINPVSDEQLFINAMKGMLKNLDDHAELLEGKSYANAQAFAQGELGEIGIQTQFDKSQNNWVVLDVVPESPASLAGLQSGYYLHEIDGVKLNKYTNEYDIKQILNGLAGSMVDVVFSNEGRRMTKVTLQRTLPKRSSVKVTLHKDIAIISIPSFQDNTRQQILDALVKLNKPVYGVVLDLRDNPGGMLTSAIDVAGLFLDSKKVVQIENKKHNIHVLKTKKNAYLDELPVIVLQNRYSASAAEVLAGSLQYHQKAKIVGETSYGKGTIQSIVPIDDDKAVKLTVAHYLMPDGTRIDGQGVQADMDFNKIGKNNMLPSVINQKTLNAHSQSFNPVIDYYNDDEKKITEMQWQKQAVDILLQQIELKKQLRRNKKRSIFSLFKKNNANSSGDYDDNGMMFVYPKLK